MAITTYTELQTAVANWLNRSDLTTRIPEFIALAEARLNRDLSLRTMESNEAVVTVIGSRFIALPAGFSEPLALFIEKSTGREEIPFVPSKMETSASQGQPYYWTIDGTNIAFERPADQVYSLTFKMLKNSALSDALPTNWLLTNYPDIYLAATLVEGFGYLQDDEALKWLARYNQTLAEVNYAENRSRAKATLRSALLPPLRQRIWDIATGGF